MARKVESKNMTMGIRKTTSKTYRKNNIPSSNPTQMLTPQKLYERIVKGLFFNCDIKYSNRYKCSENKLFYID